jgi:hypothetical protein
MMEKKEKLQVLKTGFIEATPENIKTYMDIFIESIAKDKKIDLPSEKDYTNNVKGNEINDEKFLFTDPLKIYYHKKMNKEQNDAKKKCFAKV